MCYFVNLAILPHDPHLVNALFPDRYEIVYSKQFVPSQYVRDWFYITELHQHCGCSLYSLDDSIDDITKKIRKYKNKGWSDSKISGAVGSIDARRKGRFKGIRIDICHILVKALASCHVLYIYVCDTDIMETSISESVVIENPDNIMNKIIPMNRLLELRGMCYNNARRPVFKRRSRR